MTFSDKIDEWIQEAETRRADGDHLIVPINAFGGGAAPAITPADEQDVGFHICKTSLAST
jgi:hypothetical protein